MKKKVLVVCGQTATGKTSLSIKLAKKFNGEIVTADSRQIYIGMDIITGKDIPDNSKFIIQNKKFGLKTNDYFVGYGYINNIPVWLVNICFPDRKFSVSHYHKYSSLAIKDIQQRNKLPIIVGGTGFYIKSLFEPIKTMGIKPDWQLRNYLQDYPIKKLQAELKRLDINRLKQMNESDSNNARRLIRAIEVASQNQKINSNFKKIKTKKETLEYLIIGLKAKKVCLYKKIDNRIEKRIKQGAEKEIAGLIAKYSKKNSILQNTIGYKQWLDFFAGKISKKEVLAKWRLAEYAYARRQLTWFKKQKNIFWVDINRSKWFDHVVKKVEEWYI